MEVAVVAEGEEIKLQALALHHLLVGDVEDAYLGEIGLSCDGTERSELRTEELHPVVALGMPVLEGLEDLRGVGFRDVGLVAQRLQIILFAVAHILSDIKNLVNLEGKLPTRVFLDILDGGLHNLGVALGVASVARLQKTGVGAHDAGIHAGSMDTVKNHLDFINDIEYHLGLAPQVGILGREGDPVDIARQTVGAVGLHSHQTVDIMEGIDKAAGELQRWLATRDDHQTGWIGFHGLDNLLIGHLDAALMLRVAERAVQVATRKAHEDSSAAHMIALPLERIEYFIHLHSSSSS